MKPTSCRRLIAVLAGLAIVLGAGACIKVNDNEIGVKVNNIPLLNKVVPKYQDRGYHFFIPYLFSYYKLPRTQQSLIMVERGKIEFKSSNTPEAVSRVNIQAGGTEQNSEAQAQMQEVKKELNQTVQVQLVVHDRRTGNESVRVKTADGNDAWVDVMVTYRIVPELAYRVVMNVGGSPQDVESLVGAMVRGHLRSWLGELDSKEILRAQDRALQVEGIPKRNDQGEIILDQDNRVVKLMPGAIDSLNFELGKFGIEIVKLSTPTVTIHPDYEAVLSQKRIAEEDQETYIGYQAQAKEEMQTKVNKARGEADSRIELSRGRLNRALKEADADLEAKTKLAEGLRVKYNELADGIAAQTAVLGGPGGDAQVGLAVSQAMQDKKIVIVPSQGAVNLLDLNELIQNYSAVKSLKAPAGPGPAGPRQSPPPNPAPAPAKANGNGNPPPPLMPNPPFQSPAQSKQP